MGLPIFQVDAFTDKPFKGNPAGVCILPGPKDAAWMQNVALEMNLAETAFIHPQGEDFSLRWFTPMVEVDLCGHATLAGAHILWESDILPAEEQARFHTRSGMLVASRSGGGIELNFPATPAEPAAVPVMLAVALGAELQYCGRSPFDYLVEVDSEATVRKMMPDLAALRRLGTRGIIVTARADASSEYQVVSRFFAPGVGIDEDPVTGSAHCCLGPYWGPRLGRTEFLAYQASARGGMLRVRIGGDRVYLGGQAITVIRGELAGC
jgi:predicted PhzF superfamily epimerase YddE/YHI9